MAAGAECEAQVVGPPQHASGPPAGEARLQLAPEIGKGVITQRDEHRLAQVEGQPGDRSKFLEGRRKELGGGEEVLADQADVVRVGPAQVAWQEALKPPKMGIYMTSVWIVALIE